MAAVADAFAIFTNLNSKLNDFTRKGRWPLRQRVSRIAQGSRTSQLALARAER